MTAMQQPNTPNKHLRNLGEPYFYLHVKSLERLNNL